MGQEVDSVQSEPIEVVADAAVDVVETDPSGQDDAFPPFDSPLSELDSVVLTAHVAWFSEEANDDRRRTAARDVRRVLAGETPENPVNDPR
ncbi:hypothetical protein [Salinigranum marinum]|uniref:hypothetical protein n=1 Tax=Salinigranum marinum TaxID=1515595 RepID=UPI002989DD82|nr:hypothetical protein [Salinigranum marinum]